MFSFKSKKQDNSGVLERIADNLQGIISGLSSIDRVAAFTYANALLLVCASTWGDEVTSAPEKLKRNVANETISSLLVSYARIEESFRETNGASASDPFVMACRWEMVSTQLVMITMAVSFDPKYAKISRECWKELWASQRSAPQAVDAIMEFSAEYNKVPFYMVEGRTFNRKFVIALATSLPPMFKTKKKATPKK